MSLAKLDDIISTQGLAFVGVYFGLLKPLNLLLIISMETGKAPHIARETKAIFIYIYIFLDFFSLFTKYERVFLQCYSRV